MNIIAFSYVLESYNFPASDKAQLNHDESQAWSILLDPTGGHHSEFGRGHLLASIFFGSLQPTISLRTDRKLSSFYKTNTCGVCNWGFLVKETFNLTKEELIDLHMCP
ncbi:hypothetical protein MTR_5g037335 [Medicago truncatula]|nr:hypothetical protein MTR_5g037335 [Medicago truncatula]